MSNKQRETEIVVKTGLKLKRGGALFKPAKNHRLAATSHLEKAMMAARANGGGTSGAGGVDSEMLAESRCEDVRKIDLTIRKDEEGVNSEVKKTAAELAFQKRQQETAYRRLSKRAAVSHREKVERFNKQMEELTEFNDIPKVSWTK